ncbi:MAG: dihydropteroate synthase [Saccharospirillaceae bacterium]|nr:dihydropteroate synthase [Saccharospirillaceae bacterium]
MLNIHQIAEIHRRHGSHFQCPLRSFPLGEKNFDWSHQTAIMGVINMSRDSWYRESVCTSTEMAIQRAEVLTAQGADVIDIGAESSLNHAERVDAHSQCSTLIPIIHQLRDRQFNISVETYLPSVADKCLSAGANVLNLTGQTSNPDIYRIAADHNSAIIICFVQGPNVREVNSLNILNDPIPPLIEYFSHTIELAQNAGITKIFIDPGLGFYYRNLLDSAQRIRYQTQVFLEAGALRQLGFPICQALPHAFDCFGEEVRTAEAYFAALAGLGGTSLFRTHEVPKVRAVLRTMELGSQR